MFALATITIESDITTQNYSYKLFIKIVVNFKILKILHNYFTGTGNYAVSMTLVVIIVTKIHYWQ